MHISDRGAGRFGSALVICVSMLGACTGKSSPTEPSSSNSSSSAVRGAVVEALTGRPIDGATLSFPLNGSTHVLTTSGGGLWELTERNLPGSVLFEVSAPGYLTRRTHLASVKVDGAISVDLIRDAAPFSLDFYRQLIRNQFDDPGSLLPLRRWTKNPGFYVNTRNPRTGAELTPSERDSIRAIIQALVPHMTGGRLSASAIEFGSAHRGDRSGVVALTFVDEPGNQFCGWSRVGTDPGAITLNLSSRCDTPCGTFAPRTLAHEVGHALGFFHVARGDVLSPSWSVGECGSTTLSATEQYHARLAYSRPPGNRDTDFDPLSTLFAQPAEATAVISCR
jgi:hypothetical protein